MAKTLIYDGDCSFCEWISSCFGRMGLADGAHRRAYQSFDTDSAAEMDAAGIRNEMLVRDESSGELRAGIQGFLWLLGDSHPRLAGLLGLPPLRWLLTVGYRTLAYNRRLLAPPKPGVVCACDPDPHAGYRALLWAAVLVLHLLTALSFGLAARNAVGIHAGAAVGLYILDLPAAFLLARVVSALPADRLRTQVMLAWSAGALAALPLLWLSLATSEMVARGLVVMALVAGLAAFLRSGYHRVLVRA